MFSGFGQVFAEKFDFFKISAFGPSPPGPPGGLPPAARRGGLGGDIPIWAWGPDRPYTSRAGTKTSPGTIRGWMNVLNAVNVCLASFTTLSGLSEGPSPAAILQNEPWSETQTPRKNDPKIWPWSDFDRPYLGKYLEFFDVRILHEYHRFTRCRLRVFSAGKRARRKS